MKQQLITALLVLAHLFAKGQLTVDGAVGNITYTPSGSLVYSYHPFFDPAVRVAIYDERTHTSKPYPNVEWNTPRTTDDHFFSNVLGIRNDKNGIIWILDMGQRNPVTPKIVGWNTHTNQLERIYYLPQSALAPTSQPNDMVVDTKHGVFIIADEGIGNGGDGSKAALITVDMKTGATKRLLEGTASTLPENRPVVVSGKPMLVGCDGITADKDFEWLYYGPLNGSKLYRILITDLLQAHFNIETYAAKPNNGGLSIDVDGNIYLTDLEHNSVSVILAKDRSLQTVFTDAHLIWPDGVSYNAADGYMYVSAAQVNLGRGAAKPPYYIYRFKPLAKGVPFR